MAACTTTYIIGPDNEVLSDGTYGYVYDAEGNRTEKFVDANHNGVLDAGETDVADYTWDNRNRLISVTEHGATTQVVDFLYDAEGRWIGENICNGSGVVEHETRFVYDGNQIVLQLDKDVSGAAALTASDLSHRYLYGPAVDQVLADEKITTAGQAGAVSLPLGDNQGTIRDVAKLSGSTTSVVDHVIYNSFGAVASESDPPQGCLFKYTARPLDAATGLQVNGRRVYDAAIAQWKKKGDSHQIWE